MKNKYTENLWHSQKSGAAIDVLCDPCAKTMRNEMTIWSWYIVKMKLCVLAATKREVINYGNKLW